jgi:hypothetical protein
LAHRKHGGTSSRLRQTQSSTPIDTRLVSCQLASSHRSGYLADGPDDVSSRFNRRQFEYHRPALAEWHKPLDTKPHGRGVAILRRIASGKTCSDRLSSELRELQRLVEDLAHRKLGQITRQPPQRA